MLDAGRVVDHGTHAELMGRSAHYRELISGLEEEPLRAAGDRIEELATLTRDGVTASAWQGSGTSARPRVSRAAQALAGAAGGPHSFNAVIAALPATPELLARVDALPPVRDVSHLDRADEARHRHEFGLLRLLRQFRRPLLVGLVLVVLDALTFIAGPALVKIGVDNGVTRHSTSVLYAASIAFLAVTLLDLAVLIGSTFITGRTAERIMLALRVRIWAQLQRLSLDYYERELAGRIMTRMTTDVDQFESLVSNGLLSALVAASPSSASASRCSSSTSSSGWSP